MFTRKNFRDISHISMTFAHLVQVFHSLTSCGFATGVDVYIGTCPWTVSETWRTVDNMSFIVTIVKFKLAIFNWQPDWATRWKKVCAKRHCTLPSPVHGAPSVASYGASKQEKLWLQGFFFVIFWQNFKKTVSHKKQKNSTKADS